MRRPAIPSAIRLARYVARSICTKPPNPNRQLPPLDSQQGVLQFLDGGGGAGASRNGRSWRTTELRLKSFDDLHRLWFILLKERNILLTERAWCKTNRRYWVNGHSNLYKVKRSMARIKGVVAERERALKAKQMRSDAAAGGRQQPPPSSPGLADAVGDSDGAATRGVVTRST